jgi:hypothetical protein
MDLLFGWRNPPGCFAAPPLSNDRTGLGEGTLFAFVLRPSSFVLSLSKAAP